MDDQNDTFMILDVERNPDLQSLAIRLDKFFPDRVVRLCIDGEYSPYFYDGNGNWHYKIPEPQCDVIDFYAEYNAETTINEYLSEAQIAVLNHLDAPLREFKVAGNIIVNNEHINGLFFTNGAYIIIDQAIIDNPKYLLEFLVEYYECQTIVDMTNTMNDGMIILKTDKQLFVSNKENTND